MFAVVICIYYDIHYKYVFQLKSVSLIPADRSLLEMMQVKKEKDDESFGKPEEKVQHTFDEGYFLSSPL